MEDQLVYIDLKVLESFMADVFKGAGVPEDDAKVCANVLITADKLGIESHGIGRLKPIYYDRIKLGILNPVTEFEVVKEGPTTAVVDGHDGMGHVIAHRSMQMAIEKAKQLGMGMVVVRNSSHYGIAGYYALMATGEGLIGITGTNARPSVAPTFGVENMLGTNPLTFGIPTDEEFPFLLDCASSVSQRGKIEVYDRLDKDIPPGWVIDVDGNTRTDTKQILADLVSGNAALTPLGGLGEENAGYKGYGYSTVVEILSAALQSGPFMKALSGYDPKGTPRPYSLGHFFIAINIEAFTDLAEFQQITGEILRDLRQSRKAPGQERIYTAGEKEYLASLKVSRKGVAVNRVLQEQIMQMSKELGITGYDFKF